MKWVIGFFLLLLPASAHADPKPWMKQQDPGSLGLFISTDEDCPVSPDDMKRSIEGEFREARIAPSKSLDLNITISVSCMKTRNKSGERTGYFASSNIHFGTKMAKGIFVLYESPSYGSMISLGTDFDSKVFLVDSLDRAVARALADYRSVNF